MNVHEINTHLLKGNVEVPGLFPRLEQLKTAPVTFEMHFGLDRLPNEPGVIIIRGGRQLGKSTWLENQLKTTVLEHGPGSAFYLNGDEHSDQESLFLAARELVGLFNPRAKVKRIFIDEITAIPQWEKAVKRLADQGIIKDTLMVTTGSKIIDLRRGTERLPGRKGRLARTNYRFTPVSYREFQRKTAAHFAQGKSQEEALWAYVLTGGSPVAINSLIAEGRIPEYVIELTKDWLFGETALQGRSVSSVKSVIQCLFERGGLPVSLHAVAEVAGLANNTVAQGYIDLLKDLGCVSSAAPIEANKLRRLPRKASKYHFTYLLMVTAFSKNAPRTIQDIVQLSGEQKGKLLEWLIAAELWRRSAIAGEDEPEQQYFWTNGEHEVDFIDHDHFIEVKYGNTNPSEFAWFAKVFQKRTLDVVCRPAFEFGDSGFCRSLSIEDFLLENY